MLNTECVLGTCPRSEDYALVWPPWGGVITEDFWSSLFFSVPSVYVYILGCWQSFKKGTLWWGFQAAWGIFMMFQIEGWLAHRLIWRPPPIGNNRATSFLPTVRHQPSVQLTLEKINIGIWILTKVWRADKYLFLMADIDGGILMEGKRSEDSRYPSNWRRHCGVGLVARGKGIGITKRISSPPTVGWGPASSFHFANG